MPSKAKSWIGERVRQAVYKGLLTDKVMAWLKSQTTVNWVDSEGNPNPGTYFFGRLRGEGVESARGPSLRPMSQKQRYPGSLRQLKSSSETATGAETDGEAAAAEAEPATEKAVEASPC
jgi:trigger factor